MEKMEKETMGSIIRKKNAEHKEAVRLIIKMLQEKGCTYKDAYDILSEAHIFLKEASLRNRI